MSKNKRAPQIKLIPVDRINILNPRDRNKKVFLDIANNISEVGLKRPITVMLCCSGAIDKDYDLVCGQGRLEAFLACGQTHIPAFIIDTNEEEALVMSLVENLARRQHRGPELFRGIELLKKEGYDENTIAAKTGLKPSYVTDILSLIKNGEERLLAAVGAGHLPIGIAIQVARSPLNNQRILREAYENKQLRGRKLLLVKRLIEERRHRGKAVKRDKRPYTKRGSKKISSRDVLKIYKREVNRKRLLTRKAAFVSNRLTFITEALRRLLKDDQFHGLLRAEGLLTFPEPLAGLMEQRRASHA